MPLQPATLKRQRSSFRALGRAHAVDAAIAATATEVYIDVLSGDIQLSDGMTEDTLRLRDYVAQRLRGAPRIGGAFALPDLPITVLRTSISRGRSASSRGGEELQSPPPKRLRPAPVAGPPPAATPWERI